MFVVCVRLSRGLSQWHVQCVQGSFGAASAKLLWPLVEFSRDIFSLGHRLVPLLRQNVTFLITTLHWMHEMWTVVIDDPVAWRCSLSQPVCHVGDLSYSFARWRHLDVFITAVAA